MILISIILPLIGSILLALFPIASIPGGVGQVPHRKFILWRWKGNELLRDTLHHRSTLVDLVFTQRRCVFTEREKYIKMIALIISIANFWVSILVLAYFDSNNENFQMTTTWNLVNDVTITLGIDGISLFFILLTTFLLPVCILASFDSIKYMIKEYLICLLGLEACLIFIFTVLDTISFYVFFESVLIPIFIIIGVWGSRKEKIQAAYYLFIYTLAGSVLMLLGIFILYSETGTTNYQLLLFYVGEKMNDTTQKWLWLLFAIAFMTKIPMVPFHIWLPKAHSEATLAGSIILAGVLLKLGAFGFLRYALPLFPEGCIYFQPLMFTLSILGIIYASLTTLIILDLKGVIAYSSIGHMGITTLGIFSFNRQGLTGSLFLLLAHGIASPGLFILVTLLYERFHSRIIKYYRGVAITMPIYAIIFLIFTLSNLGLPLLVNFIGEFITLIGVYKSSSIVTFLATTGVIISAAYSLFLYNRVCFGTVSNYIAQDFNNRDITRKEFHLLLPLVVLVILLGVYPEIILSEIKSSISFLSLI